MAKSVLSDLSSLLWREREVLDQLVTRLRLGESTDTDSTDVLASIASLEVHRAITAREVASEIGLIGEPTLQDLVVKAPPEWAPVLASHRRALVGLQKDLRALLRPVGVPVEGNVVTLPVQGSSRVSRSLLEFLG